MSKEKGEKFKATEREGINMTDTDTGEGPCVEVSSCWWWCHSAPTDDDGI